MAEKEQYSTGYDKSIVKQLVQRNLSNNAAFVLPFLKSGMQVLDCGCGPGSLSQGFAEIVAPARVIGLDMAHSQVALARENGFHENLSFAQGNVYQLPFADESFDVAFAHAVLYHLKNPIDALSEMYRILRSGGLIAIRDTDFGGSIDYPDNPLINRASELLRRYIAYNGGNPYFGREQRAMLRRVGFRDVQISASYDVHQTKDEMAAIAGFLIQHFSKQEVRTAFFEQGWVNQGELSEIQDALVGWKDNPEAFSLHCRMEAIGWKN